MPKAVNTRDINFLVVCVCQHCTLDLGSYIKDLSIIHGDLSSVAILDNSPAAYRSHPGNISIYCLSTHFLLYLFYFCLNIGESFCNCVCG